MESLGTSTPECELLSYLCGINAMDPVTLHDFPKAKKLG